MSEIDVKNNTPTLNIVNHETVVGGMVVGVPYVALKEFTIDSIVIPKGCSVSIEYEFKPYKPGSYAYEHFTFCAWTMNIRNHNEIFYFKDIEEMELALFGFEFELDSCQVGRWVDYHFQKVQTIIDDYSPFFKFELDLDAKKFNISPKGK